LIDLKQFTYELVKPHEGSEFRLDFEDGTTVTLLLKSVSLLKEKHANARMTRDAFSMAFDGPASPYLPQKMYLMQHAELGSPLGIFIVPLEKMENGLYRYEAIFN
jgi:hypothetical protein